MLDRSDSDDGDKAEMFDIIYDSESNNNNLSTVNETISFIDQTEIEFSESFAEKSPSQSIISDLSPSPSTESYVPPRREC